MTNERIKEIATRAGCSYLYDYSVDGPAMVCNVEDIENFAKLLIEDCVNICQQHGNSAVYSYTPSKAIVAKNTAHGCATLIKRSFNFE